MAGEQVANHFILYMEDDADDVEMLQKAIDTIDPTLQLRIAADGEEGLQLLAQLKQQGRLPRLIVLDINMPRMDGRKTLLKIKSDNMLSTIPIVIFSTSSSPMDKLFFQNKNVEYITKPLTFSHLVEVAGRLLKYLKEE